MNCHYVKKGLYLLVLWELVKRQLEKVAKKLYRDFVDIDEEIEKEFGMPTTEIFEKFGEKTFREREKSIIIGLSKQPLNSYFSWWGSVSE